MPEPAAPAAAGAAAPAAAPAPKPTQGSGASGLPTEADFDAQYGEDGKGPANPEPKNAAPEPPKKADAPTDDPDGDTAFEAEFKDFKMPDGLRSRIKKLTDQRNLTRTEAKTLKESLEKEYGYFKPYATDDGRKYLQMLVEFDGMMEKATGGNPWLADLIRDVVLEGKPADVKKLVAALGQGAAGGEGGEGAGEGEGANADPRDKTLKDLQGRMARWEEEKAKVEESTRRRSAVDKEKETYRAEIADWTTKFPQYKDDKVFIKRALRDSAASNISFVEAAKELHEYLSGREQSKLTELAKADGERAGAGVETPGRGGVPRKDRPAVGSDEELEQMLEFFGSGAKG